MKQSTKSKLTKLCIEIFGVEPEFSLKSEGNGVLSKVILPNKNDYYGRGKQGINANERSAEQAFDFLSNSRRN